MDDLIECLTLNVRNLEIGNSWFLHIFLKLIEGFCSPWCGNVLVRRCDETCVVNKCGINTFLNVIIHVIVKCKVIALSCELWTDNHTTVRPFKGDKLMHDEYCDAIPYGNPTSWITLRHNELKWFWKQLSSCVYYIIQTLVTHIWF